MRFVGSDASLVKTSRVGDVPAKTFEVVGVSGVGATRSARGVQRRHLIPGVDLKGRDIFDLPTLSPLASSLSPAQFLNTSCRINEMSVVRFKRLHREHVSDA